LQPPSLVMRADDAAQLLAPARQLPHRAEEPQPIGVVMDLQETAIGGRSC
jgi:hypothetical protein